VTGVADAHGGRCPPAAAQCQPLHNASRFSKTSPGDAGADFVLVGPPPCKNDTSAEELHALWGGAIGISSDPEAVISLAKVLPTQAVDANDQDVDLWVSESLKPAETKVYIAPMVTERDHSQLTTRTGMNACYREQGLVQGGMRLANLPNANLKYNGDAAILRYCSVRSRSN